MHLEFKENNTSQWDLEENHPMDRPCIITEEMKIAVLSV